MATARGEPSSAKIKIRMRFRLLPLTNGRTPMPRKWYCFCMLLGIVLAVILPHNASSLI